ncbi:hypothetical protein [Haloechinothrix salitolerans]|uniref:Uncharacterized protein n=1 Tax=Haloechinothrix salitolerans TaxID=926830 RepID=A0ABW2CAI8_9PSEU
MSQPPINPERQPPERYRHPQPPYEQPYQQHGPPAYPPQRPQAEPPPPPPPSPGRGFRLPGLGLILTLLGLVVQLLSVTVLPWLAMTNGTSTSQSLVDLWSGDVDLAASGFGESYVEIFSYPLVVLGVLLAFAAVLESVALKVIWGGLALIGAGFLALKYGLGSFVDLGDTIGGDVELTPLNITIGMVAIGVLVVVIFVLKTAVAMFRRVAIAILLVSAAVHVAAVADISSASDLTELSIGAFGPAVGYLLCAAAAMAPRRLPGM